MLINDDYKIESDNLNVTLYKRRKDKKGETFWRAEGFFKTLKGAIDALVEKEILGTGLKDVKDVYAKIEELKWSILKEARR